MREAGPSPPVSRISCLLFTPRGSGDFPIALSQNATVTPARRDRSGLRAGSFQVLGPGLASAGLRPARRREHLPSCAVCRLALCPEAGLSGHGPAGFPGLHEIHPPLCPSPSSLLRGLRFPCLPHSGGSSQSWAPRAQLPPMRRLPFCPSPPTRPRAVARRILFNCLFSLSFLNSRTLDAPEWSLHHPVDTPSTC